MYIIIMYESFVFSSKHIQCTYTHVHIQCTYTHVHIQCTYTHVHIHMYIYVHTYSTCQIHYHELSLTYDNIPL